MWGNEIRTNAGWSGTGLVSVMRMPVDRLSFLVFFILSLSVMDYFFTLRHLMLGLKEINPIMDYLFTLGWWQAFFFKYSMTAIGLVLLCSLGQDLRIKPVFSCIAVLYSALTLYHMYLLRVC